PRARGRRRGSKEQTAPRGPVSRAGALSGSPVAMAAGRGTLAAACEPGFRARLAEKTTQLVDGILNAARAANIPLSANQVCGMFGLFFTDKPSVRYFREVMACDVERFKAFFHAMLQEGVYLAPSAFEAGFVSSAHTDLEIDATIAAASAVFKRMRSGA